MTETTKFLRNWQVILGQLLAQVSDRMTGLGLIWVVTEKFGENWVTWYLVIGGLPHLLLSPVSARVIRKVGAILTVISSDLIRFLLFFAATFTLRTVTGTQDLMLIFLLIFISNCFAALFNPAILTLPLELEHGTRVQGLTAQLSTVTSLVTVIGPLLGMLCFQQFGLQGLFLITSFSYLLSGVLTWTLRHKTSFVAPPQGEIPQNILQTLKNNPLVSTMLFIFLLMNLLLSPLQVQMPYLAKNAFSGSFNALAGMEMALGFGIFIGGLVLSFYSIKTRELRWTWYFLVAIGLFFLSFQLLDVLPFGLLDSLPLRLGPLAFMGVFMGLANILIINIFQSHPKTEHVPNIMSLVNLISVAAVPVSLIGVGLLQTVTTIPSIGLGCGIILMGICLLSFFPFNLWGKKLF